MSIDDEIFDVYDSLEGNDNGTKAFDRVMTFLNMIEAKEERLSAENTILKKAIRIVSPAGKPDLATSIVNVINEQGWATQRDNRKQLISEIQSFIDEDFNDTVTGAK